MQMRNVHIKSVIMQMRIAHTKFVIMQMIFPTEFILKTARAVARVEASAVFSKAR